MVARQADLQHEVRLPHVVGRAEAERAIREGEAQKFSVRAEDLRLPVQPEAHLVQVVGRRVGAGAGQREDAEESRGATHRRILK